MVPWIPTEIIEAVVNHLCDDKPTLSTCTLVSWAWVPRSRFRLFRFLTYHAPSDGSGFAPFLDFLQSSPKLGGLIHDLKLDGFIKVHSFDRKSRVNEVISHSTLLDILDFLPALSDFELRHVWFTRPFSWTEEENRRFEIGTVREVALRKLVLHSIGYVDRRGPPRTTQFEFCSLLSIFSSVQELHIHRLSSSFSPYDPTKSRVKLRNPLYGQTQPFSLVVHDRYYPDELWDAIHRISSPVRSLFVKGHALKHVKRFKDIDIGLEHLSLNCMSGATYLRKCLLVPQPNQLTSKSCLR